MMMLKKILYKIKKLVTKEKCQDTNNALEEIDKIRFEDEYYYVNNKQYDIKSISKILYGVNVYDIEDIKYYIVLVFSIETDNITPKKGFKLINPENFISEIKRFNIPVIPTITNGGIYTIPELILTINFTSIIYGKYLVSVYYSTFLKKNFSLDNINLNDFLEKPAKYISTNYKDENSLNIKILSDKLTLNRGYGIYPILNDEIMTNDIFYSFNEDEIKAKIEEIFKKYEQ